jgi:hypothetical protein
MGIVRSYDFDAVIGIGGIGSKARSNEIGGKIVWIGIGTHKQEDKEKRGPVVLFKQHFFASALADRIFARKHQSWRRTCTTRVRDDSLI